MPAIAAEECVDQFEIELGKVSGAFHRAGTIGELETILRKILTDSQARSTVITRNPLLAKLKLAERVHAWGIFASSWPESAAGANEAAEAQPGGTQDYRGQCFLADVGISGVDFALAETGSLVVSSETEGSQLASLAPPIHVALYRRAQVVSSLDDVLARCSAAQNPGAPASGRSMVFITGPSRTADIEQILIRGVHGPREVHAILVEESCLAELGRLDAARREGAS